jgi:hypothetical protein
VQKLNLNPSGFDWAQYMKLFAKENSESASQGGTQNTAAPKDSSK